MVCHRSPDVEAKKRAHSEPASSSYSAQLAQTMLLSQEHSSEFFQEEKLIACQTSVE